MKTINKICVFDCVHGNEKFGLKVLSHLEAIADERLCLHIGNLEAVAKNVRFIEADLNRSFDGDAQTKESKIAKLIQKHLLSVNPDLVIDIHTSTVDVGKTAIISESNDFLVSASKMLAMDNCVKMIPEVATKSLIGQLPGRSIAIEFGVGLRSDALAAIMAKKVANLAGTNIKSKLKFKEYEVIRLVAKEELTNLKFKNFNYCEKLDGYPFLMGEKNYGDIAGFLARPIG